MLYVLILVLRNRVCAVGYRRLTLLFCLGGGQDGRRYAPPQCPPSPLLGAEMAYYLLFYAGRIMALVARYGKSPQAL